MTTDTDTQELQLLVRCTANQNTLQSVYPYIVAIRVEFGPRKAAEVFSDWCKNNGIPLYTNVLR